ncbi:MAG: alanine dehydrogenase, partial [Anaerolineae bacterium]|nr:alanine dehydrogenase [Anaerolineae bacterium]
MNIGIPKEIRPSEYRVGLSPAGVHMLVKQGHTCYIEHQAGLGAGFTDQDYEHAGGQIVYTAAEAFGRADLVLKVSRPLEPELGLLRPEAILAGFLHLPSARQSKIDYLVNNKISAIAYEQIQLPDGSRPVLRPLSDIGGRMSAQIAARLMQNNAGGKGILLGGMPGVPPAEVAIIGAGVAGHAAARAFRGMGAQVTVLDVDGRALERIHTQFPGAVTMFYTPANIRRVCAYADVVIAAAMIPGQPAPMLISRSDVQSMKPRSLIMDISIDQGGCVET